MCCSVLQCVAVCYSVLQCVAVCCSVLQCLAMRCSANGPCRYGDTDQIITSECVAAYCSVAVDCSVLNCVAVLPRLAATVLKGQLCGQFTRHIQRL